MSVFGPVADAAEELRDVLQVAFVARETAGGPSAPDRILTTEGVPAADFCEQVAVYVEAVRVGVAGEVAPGGAINPATATQVVVDLAAQSMRCAAPMAADGRSPPSVVALEASARTVNSDADVLVSAVLEAVADQSLWGWCTRASITECRGIENEGGSVGFLLRVTLAL